MCVVKLIKCFDLLVVFVFHLFLLVLFGVHLDDSGWVSVVSFCAEAQRWVSLVDVAWPIFLNVHSQFLGSRWNIFLDVYFLHLNLIWINWCLIVFIFFIRGISTLELKTLLLLLFDISSWLTLIGDRLWLIRIFLFRVELLVLATFDAIEKPECKVLQ